MRDEEVPATGRRQHRCDAGRAETVGVGLNDSGAFGSPEAVT
jgi:hypothetical protein